MSWELELRGFLISDTVIQQCIESFIESLSEAQIKRAVLNLGNGAQKLSDGIHQTLPSFVLFTRCLSSFQRIINKRSPQERV
jgi:hypothetical protein